MVGFKRLVFTSGLCALIGLGFDAQAFGFKMRKIVPPAVTLAGASFLKYTVNEIEKEKRRFFEDEIEEYPEWHDERLLQAKKFLIKTVPVEHQDLAARVKFVNGTCVSSSGLSSSPAIALPAGDEKSTHKFVYLHEMAHIIHNDYEKELKFSNNSFVIFTTGLMYSLLKSTGFKSFGKRAAIGLPVYLWGGSLFIGRGGPVMKSYLYAQETKADQFAIDCLKKHKDIQSLQIAADWFRKDSKTSRQIEVEKLNPLFRPFFTTHPSSCDRANKIEAAIREL